MNDVVKITKDISLSQFKDDPVGSYQSLLKSWVFNPCELLLSNKDTDYGLAIIMLLLSFFEHHGQLIEGEDSNGKSKHYFTLGFSEFYKWLKEKSDNKSIPDFGINNLYKFLRCGLFHSLNIKEQFLIDAVSYNGDQSFKAYHKMVIISPQNFTRDLQEYVIYYLSKIETEETLKHNFESMISVLLLDPIGKHMS